MKLLTHYTSGHKRTGLAISKRVEGAALSHDPQSPAEPKESTRTTFLVTREPPEEGKYIKDGDVQRQNSTKGRTIQELVDEHRETRMV